MSPSKGFINGQGYRVVYVNGAHMREHRYVMEKLLGRKLRRGEIVHHKDGNRSNNAPENLELFPSHGKHRHHHSKSYINRQQKRCQCCGEIKTRKEFYLRGDLEPGWDRHVSVCKSCKTTYFSERAKTGARTQDKKRCSMCRKLKARSEFAENPSEAHERQDPVCRSCRTSLARKLHGCIRCGKPTKTKYCSHECYQAHKIANRPTEKHEAIRARYATGTVSLATLGKEFGLSFARIHQIVHHKFS